jgi:hypothetical protein
MSHEMNSFMSRRSPKLAKNRLRQTALMEATFFGKMRRVIVKETAE